MATNKSRGRSTASLPGFYPGDRRDRRPGTHFAAELGWGTYRTQDPSKIEETTNALFALYERGALCPVVSSTRPLTEAAAALEEIAARKSVGKVLLVPQKRARRDLAGRGLNGNEHLEERACLRAAFHLDH